MKVLPVIVAAGLLVLVGGLAHTVLAPAADAPPGQKKDKPDDSDKANPDKEKSKVEPADNSRCFVCHGNYKKEKLTVRHAKGGVGCERCHGPSDAHCQDEEHQTPPDTMYPKEKIPPACIACHDMDKIAKKHKEKDVEADLKGVKNVCTDCHGSHRLEKRSVRWDKNTRKVLP